MVLNRPEVFRAGDLYRDLFFAQDGEIDLRNLLVLDSVEHLRGEPHEIVLKYIDLNGQGFYYRYFGLNGEQENLLIGKPIGEESVLITNIYQELAYEVLSSDTILSKQIFKFASSQRPRMSLDNLALKIEVVLNLANKN